MKSIVFISSLIFAFLAIGTLGYNYISTEPTTNVISKSSDTNDTGIKVNGEWELIVYNKNGSIEATHEFTNDLDPVGGASLLVGLLTGGHPDNSKYPLYWLTNVSMAASSGNNLLQCSNLDEEGQYIFSDVSRDSYSFTISSSCKVTSPNNQSSIPDEGYIGKVSTRWWYMIKSTDGELSTAAGITTINPDTGMSGPQKSHYFTSKSFYAKYDELKVTEGQSVSTNVKISFE